MEGHPGDCGAGRGRVLQMIDDVGIVRSRFARGAISDVEEGGLPKNMFDPFFVLELSGGEEGGG